MKDFWIRRAKADDIEAICDLLNASKLPVEGVADAHGNFIVAEGNGLDVVGAAGLEVYGRFGLLRSVVVSDKWKGYGVGRALTGEIISRARARGIETVFLLTTTAEGYFPAFGFVAAERSDVPDELQASTEFQGACPASAILMKLPLFSSPA